MRHLPNGATVTNIGSITGANIMVNTTIMIKLIVIHGSSK